MDEISQEFGEILKEGSGTPPDLSPEELEAQTTNFLLAFIEQMQMSDEEKAKLRNNIIDRALNPDKYPPDEEFERKPAGISPEEIIRLIALLVVVFGVLGFFGYKLYKSIMEKEQKVKKSKKDTKKEKKVNSPPSSPRSKKD